ncbi:hypothetical protein [Roseixanthobacter pseudopolyaromaticivorans]|uniref:hypothetical protein n=1 Tax=Xanthobacteraceae TaxID=335928 RepID=UPI003728C940
MRIAVLIISLCLVAILGLQSCAIMVGSNLISDKTTSEAGAAGLVMAFMFVLGGAFAMGLPRLSAAIFLAAGLIGFAMASASIFRDLQIWAGISCVLAVLALLGRREIRKAN